MKIQPVKTFQKIALAEVIQISDLSSERSYCSKNFIC